jgi:DNA polymerase-3 subunit epsilon
MDFVTIDFETANSNLDSPCEIGLTVVKEGMIVDTHEWLINPQQEFNYFNIKVHGIRPEHVAYQPEFDELWDDIQPIIENQFLIAHNASFDMGVLRKTLEYYSLPYPNVQYACSVSFSKRIWVGLPKYNLKSLCDLHGIKFHHHRAGADSRATAELSIKAFEAAGIDSLDDFKTKLNIQPGRISEGEHYPALSIPVKKYTKRFRRFKHDEEF